METKFIITGDLIDHKGLFFHRVACSSQTHAQRCFKYAIGICNFIQPGMFRSIDGYRSRMLHSYAICNIFLLLKYACFILVLVHKVVYKYIFINNVFFLILYKKCTSARLIIFITQFRVTMAMSCRALARYMNVSHILGHDRASSLLFQYIASIL